MPTSAPRPRVLDISEIRSSTAPSLAIWGMVEFKMLQNIPQLNLAMRYGDVEVAGLIRCPPRVDPGLIQLRSASPNRKKDSVDVKKPISCSLRRLARSTNIEEWLLLGSSTRVQRRTKLECSFSSAPQDFLPDIGISKTIN